MAKKSTTNAITQFTPASLKLLREEIDAALAAITKKHGVSMSIGKISFSAQQCSTTLSMVAACNTGEAQNPEKVNWDKYAELFGLSKDDFGKTFQDGGKTYKVDGVAPRSTRFPIIVEREDGQRFKFPESRVKLALSIATKAATKAA